MRLFLLLAVLAGVVGCGPGVSDQGKPTPEQQKATDDAMKKLVDDASKKKK